MRYVTAGNYRHFFPVAPDRHFYLPIYDVSGNKSWTFTYMSDGSGVQELPKFFNEVYGTVSVTCNRLDLDADSFRYDSFTLIVSSYFVETANVDEEGNMTVENVLTDTPPPTGALVVVTVTSSEQDDGWQHLDFRDILVQGANPSDEFVLQTYNNFQGGYRLDLNILVPAQFGMSKLSDYKVGVDYRVPFGFKGLDRIGYQLVTEFGQKSEPACIFLHMGA